MTSSPQLAARKSSQICLEILISKLLVKVHIVAFVNEHQRDSAFIQSAAVFTHHRIGLGQQHCWYSPAGTVLVRFDRTRALLATGESLKLLAQEALALCALQRVVVDFRLESSALESSTRKSSTTTWNLLQEFVALG